MAQNEKPDSRWRRILLNSLIYRYDDVGYPLLELIVEHRRSKDIANLVSFGHVITQFPNLLIRLVASDGKLPQLNLLNPTINAAFDYWMRHLTQMGRQHYVNFVEGGTTALHEAALHCFPAIVKQLLDNGAAIDFQSYPQGATALMRCVQRSFSASQNEFKDMQIETLGSYFVS